MNDELQKQIATILLRALAAAQHGGQWIAGQIPDVLRQLLIWTEMKGFATLVLWIIGLIVGFFATFKWSNQQPESWGDWRMSKIACCFATAAWAIVFGIAMICTMYDALEAIFVPKLFLLEYAASLLKH